jgi:hypothetical protein
VSHRADIYALACVLYECVTGSPPYEMGDLPALINAHLTAPIPRPSQRRPEIPAGFDDVIARGMAKNLDDRYASAGELARAAQHALTASDQDQADTILADTQAAATGDHFDFNLNDLFDAAGRIGGANTGDLFGVLFGRGAGARPSQPRRGNDLETEAELSFVEATKGSVMPLRLTSPVPCTNCRGSGARPGTSPKVCSTCNGSGVISRNQGAFGFAEPCTDCRGTGSIIKHPCRECKGTGVATRSRTINVRIPPGVQDGQRIRLPGQGEAGLRGAPSGDLYVTVHVRPG